ncbi:MAG: hypothetical protein IT381_23655 [Deltaproteobacteria bacterium]|nr:hypothetical protein [Deltaproteobacteria bacterium]
MSAYQLFVCAGLACTALDANSMPAAAISGSPQSIYGFRAEVTRLQPATRYEFTLCAIGAGTPTYCTAHFVGVTLASPPPPPPPPASPPPPPPPPPTNSSTSAGCGLVGATVGFRQETITVNGQDRSYFVSVPPAYDAAVPLQLVFGFHGYQWQGNTFRDSFPIETTQSGGQAIFVYPNGATSGATWDLSPTGRDVAFFDALLARVSTRYCIDLQRVLVYGRSYGAMFTNTLACTRANVIRAGAVLSGSGPQTSTCAAPVRMWIYHGTADPTVLYANGVTSRDTWLAVDQCTPGSSAPDPDRPVECRIYSNCASQRSVEWCSDGGAHWHPAYSVELIWKFFQR